MYSKSHPLEEDGMPESDRVTESDSDGKWCYNRFVCRYNDKVLLQLHLRCGDTTL